MKAVDGWIVTAAVVALALAGALVYKAHRQNNGDIVAMPSAASPAPSADAFPTCKQLVPGIPRMRCEIGVARSNGQVRCVGGRLYFVSHEGSGSKRFHPWPPSITCWTKKAGDSGGN
jgi:hypothetical protein